MRRRWWRRRCAHFACELPATHLVLADVIGVLVRVRACRHHAGLAADRLVLGRCAVLSRTW